MSILREENIVLPVFLKQNYLKRFYYTMFPSKRQDVQLLPDKEFVATKLVQCLYEEEITVDDRNLQAFGLILVVWIPLGAHQYQRILIFLVIAEMSITCLQNVDCFLGVMSALLLRDIFCQL